MLPPCAGKQATAFSKGTVYYRHGAKSEPGTSEDLRRSFDRLLKITRKEWMSGVRKIVNAPSGAKVTVLPPDVRQTIHPAATPIQIVNDPSAPAYHMVRPDEQYPYRQKELIAAVRKELPNVQINGYDVLCIRRTHNVDQDKNFFYSPKFGSPQYSRDFATWIAQQVRKDKDFFERARRQAQGTQCDGD